MIFLIEYDREKGELSSFRPFGDAEKRRLAQDAKLELEIKLHRSGIQREVVLLEAESEKALRQGYRRYFEDLPTLLQSSIEQLKALGH